MAEHGEFLDMIVQEVNGLDRIATEFLEFSRVTPPEMRPVSVNAMLSRLLQFMSAYLTDQDVQVVQNFEDDLPELSLDRSQMEQVIKNIVINAVQAMPHGGTLTVATRRQPQQDIVDIDFTDTGVGIPANKTGQDLRPVLHDQDQRHRPGPGDCPQDRRNARRAAGHPQHAGRRLDLHDPAADPSGSRRHDPAVPDRDHRPAQRPARADLRILGRLLRSESLDRPSDHRRTSRSMAAEPAAPKTKTLLIADDEPNIRRVLQAIFIKDGYEVHVAENGVKALEWASANPVSLLITDLIMPDMNGVELIQKVKQTPPGRRRHRHHGLRDHQDLRGRHALRRVGLHHQAVRHGRDPGRRQARRRARRRSRRPPPRARRSRAARRRRPCWQTPSAPPCRRS